MSANASSVSAVPDLAGLPDLDLLDSPEFAGAVAQLGAGALLVNPFDTQGTARALRRERAARMRKLRDEVRRHDVFW